MRVMSPMATFAVVLSAFAGSALAEPVIVNAKAYLDVGSGRLVEPAVIVVDARRWQGARLSPRSQIQRVWRRRKEKSKISPASSARAIESNAASGDAVAFGRRDSLGSRS